MSTVNNQYRLVNMHQMEIVDPAPAVNNGNRRLTRLGKAVVGIAAVGAFAGTIGGIVKAMGGTAGNNDTGVQPNFQRQVQPSSNSSSLTNATATPAVTNASVSLTTTSLPTTTATTADITQASTWLSSAGINTTDTNATTTTTKTTQRPTTSVTASTTVITTETIEATTTNTTQNSTTPTQSSTASSNATTTLNTTLPPQSTNTSVTGNAIVITTGANTTQVTTTPAQPTTTTPAATTEEPNPLFPDVLTSGLPKFLKIKPEHVVPALEKAAEESKAALAEVQTVLSSTAPTWNNTWLPLERTDDRLNQILHLVDHLKTVNYTKLMDDAYKAGFAKVAGLTQHTQLNDAYKEIQSSSSFANLTLAQQKSINNTLINFKHSGIELSVGQQERFSEINQKLSALSRTFVENVRNSARAEARLILEKDESKLNGLPDFFKAQAKAKAKAMGHPNDYLLTLDPSSFRTFITYCDDRNLRENMYKRYFTLASDQSSMPLPSWDNSKVIEEIVQLKHEMAGMLNFTDYATLSLEKKMLHNTTQVVGFLNEIVDKVYPTGQKEFQTLQDFARNTHGIEKLEAWDTYYYAEKLRQREHDISENEIRDYFPKDHVLSGMFNVTNQIFNITVQERTGVETWNPDVKFYDVLDSDGKECGGVYLDLYADRNTKRRPGAWMNDWRKRRIKEDGGIQKPIAFATYNLPKPAEGEPALFTHREVVNLFHEFGHALHHVLTKIDVPSVAGIRGIPWDAVEIPSQFLENWCWDKEALKIISSHYQTNATLPDDKIDSMLAAKKYEAATTVLRKAELALFDINLFSQTSNISSGQIQEMVEGIRNHTSAVPSYAWKRDLNTLTHVFAGGYSAGLYGYLWSEALSADLFSQFEGKNIFNQTLGKKFMSDILERGGSEEPMVLFERFMGRAPSYDTFLRHHGINFTSTEEANSTKKIETPTINL